MLIPSFSLLTDVFPGVDYVPVDLEALRKHIVDVCNERQLVAGDLWVNKILQLYQIQKIQHGLMMVGPSGTGKTNAWRVLLAALERLDGTEGVAYVIDPKAMHKEALYGTLDPTTREWNDGLFTHILRKIVDDVRGESSKRHWIIFDGDVDPEWVENLNRYVYLHVVLHPLTANCAVSSTTISCSLFLMENVSICLQMSVSCLRLST
jgi:dynein heavy chain 1